MANFIQGTQLRTMDLGRYVQGQTADITTNGAKTYSVFTVAGGEVLITALWGKATTSLTVADTVNMQLVPTAGNTMTLVTATDLGTTDTVTGSVVGLTRGTSAASAFLVGGTALLGALVTTGSVKSVVTGTSPDGVMQWFCTYVPLTAGATLVASTVAPV